MKKRIVDFGILDVKRRLNYDEAEIVFGLKKSTIKSWKENGLIGYYKTTIGRQLLFDRKELEDLMIRIPSAEEFVRNAKI